MKTPIIAFALLTALPVLGAEEKKPKKEPEAQKVEKAKKKPNGRRVAKPQEDAKAASGMSDADLRRQLTRHQEERKQVVTAVNQSHDAFEGINKEIKAKQEHLNKLKAESTKTAGAIEHLKKKAAAVEKAHQTGHAKEEALNKKIATLEGELKRREQISALEKQAAELNKKAEALRKKAAELKKD